MWVPYGPHMGYNVYILRSIFLLILIYYSLGQECNILAKITFVFIK